MYNILIRVSLCVLAALFPMWASAAKIKIQDGPEMNIWGFAQIVGEAIDKEENDDLKFTADRVRFGTKVKWDHWFGAFQFDARDSDGGRQEGTLGDGSFIRDAVVGYQFSNAFKISTGQFKGPIGMAYTSSGSDLPLMRRTMSSRLTLDRMLGVMASGRYIGGDKKTGGFGYDLGLFNPAGRAKPYNDTDLNNEGDALSYVARLHYQYGKVFHFQVAYAEAEDAGGESFCRVTGDDNTSAIVGLNAITTDGCDTTMRDGEETAVDYREDSEDYEVFDIGAVYKNGPVRLRAEYIDGENAEGLEDYDEMSWFVEGGYQFTDMIEGVVRYQSSECDDCKGVEDDDRELSRTEIGVNLFLGQNRKNGRVQLYAANVGQDEEDYNGNAGGGNNKYDMVGAQLQLSF